MNLRSFGCSFTAGTDLYSSDNVWTNVIADRLGLLHINHAEAAIGNLRIAESAMRYSNPGDLCVVNWTWIDRFDFVDCHSEQWNTILPTDNTPVSKNYYRYLHSQYRDMLVNLMHAVSLIDHFERNKIRCVMTVIDDLWFTEIKPEWHDPRTVTHLQQRLRPYMYFFEGKTFLDWSREKEFPISEAWHPMDPAHFAAADLMQPAIESILHRA